MKKPITERTAQTIEKAYRHAKAVNEAASAAHVKADKLKRLAADAGGEK